jgi:hypothetical protein
MRGHRRDIMEDIHEERIRQDHRWGGAKHDDKHTVGEWRAYRERYEGKTYHYHKMNDYLSERESLLKIAALAVAQIESLDRQFGEELATQAEEEVET